MDGDLGLRIRLALKTHGLAEVLAMLGGVAGLTAVYLPWYEIDADVSMLGATRGRTIAALAGWQAQPWIWVGAALAVVAAGVGMAMIVDRPPPDVRGVLLAVAGTMATLAGVSAVVTPPRARFFTDRHMQQLQSLTGRVPEDVEVVFSVHTAGGLWIAVAAAVTLLAAGWAAGER